MINTKTVAVDLGARSYQIHIGKGLLEQIDMLTPEDLTHVKAFILYDKNTYPYAQVIEDALAGKVAQSKMFGVKGGEPTKSYAGLSEVLDWLLENKVDRHSILFTLGGGVVGDLGGFAASIVMRGIPFVQIPTTLLAQVDSSVGGKTGINTVQGKNLVGSFYQPKAVICDLGTLGTLPEREIKAGYAEVVKYGLINDADFFSWLDDHHPDVLSLDPKALVHAVETSCKSKANIVAADEHEKGQRALLNLGHTFGHALEASAGYDGRLLHGEAIAIGMVLAFRLSVNMGLCEQEDLTRVETHFKNCGLKTEVREISPALKHSAAELVDLMAGDKKAQAGKIGFILARGIGKAFQSYEVNLDDVIQVVEESMT